MFSLIAIQPGAGETFQSGAQRRTRRHCRPSSTEKLLCVLSILETFPMHISQVLNISHCYDVMGFVCSYSVYITSDTLLQIWGFVFTAVVLKSKTARSHKMPIFLHNVDEVLNQ